MASSPTPSAAPRVPADVDAAADAQARRLSIGFINWAHAIDHYVILILATVN